jgi:hypothetical protein
MTYQAADRAWRCDDLGCPSPPVQQDEEGYPIEPVPPVMRPMLSTRPRGSQL